MANFLEATAQIEERIDEYLRRLERIDAHMRRGERRAAAAQLDGFLEELIDFARELEMPLETMVIGAQLGFFSGGEFLRGRIPGAVLGVAAGWLYGQQVMQRHRLAIEELAEAVATLTLVLQAQTRQRNATTEEIDRPSPPRTDLDSDPVKVTAPKTASDRVTLEVDRES